MVIKAPRTNSRIDRNRFRPLSSLKHWPVRTKLAAVIVFPALLAVYLAGSTAMSAWGTATDYARISDLSELSHQVTPLIEGLQTERDRTNIFVASGRATGGDAVRAQQAQVDQAIAGYRAVASGIDSSYNPGLTDLITRAERELDGLRFVRDAAQSGGLTRGSILAGYTETIGTLLGLVSGVVEPRRDDQRLAADVRAIADAASEKEYTSQLRGELAAVATVGRYAAGQHEAMLNILAQQRAAGDAFKVGGNETQRATYTATVTGAEITQGKALLDAAMNRPNARSIGVDATLWFDLSSRKLTMMGALTGQLLTQLDTEIKRLGSDATWDAVTAISVLLIVLGAAAFLTIRVVRSITQPLRALDAHSLALRDQVDAVVDRIREDDFASLTGLEVKPTGLNSRDEIGTTASCMDELVTAFDTLTRSLSTAHENLQTGLGHLAVRVQGNVVWLVDRLDRMERNEIKPEVLAELFELDHGVALIRRRVESMLVLTGRHRKVLKGTTPLALHETIMGAIGHIEHYNRVKPSVAPDCVVAPHVVSDVIHLLSELLDNATRHSGLDKSVTVSYEDALVSGDGVTVVIRDDGFGMRADHLQIANARVSSVEGLNPDTVQHMGLHVVGRLAIRHGIQVKLHSGAQQGVTARVDLPDGLISARTARQSVTAPLPAVVEADSPGRESVPAESVWADRHTVTHVGSKAHLSLAAQWRRIAETWADPPS